MKNMTRVYVAGCESKEEIPELYATFMFSSDADRYMREVLAPRFTPNVFIFMITDNSYGIQLGIKGTKGSWTLHIDKKVR